MKQFKHLGAYGLIIKDEKIVEMYWQRTEKAIEETEKKYGRFCNCPIPSAQESEIPHVNAYGKTRKTRSKGRGFRKSRHKNR